MRHVARILLITLALILLGLALTPKASPAQTANPCDPTRLVPYWWDMSPQPPCANDSVSVVFRSCKDCVQLLSYEWPSSGPLRVYMRTQDVCPLTLVCRPDSLRIPLGRLAAGHYELAVDVVVGVVYGDSGYCTFTRRDTVRFWVGCPAPPPDSLPYVQRVVIGGTGPCTLCPPVICPGQPIPLHIDGMFPNGCYRFAGLELLPSPIASPLPQPPLVRLLVDLRVCGPCTFDTPSFSADTLLPPLPAGSYNLMLQLVRVERCDSLIYGAPEFNATKAFTVRDSCGPVPQPGPLPYVTAMTLDGTDLCARCIPLTCPGLPIPFHVEGVFPNDCLQFRKIELIPSLPTVIGPPTIRIVVAKNDCLRTPACYGGTFPWSANVALPGLPPGSYPLPVELALVSWCDSTQVDSVFRAARPFAVRDSCPVTPGACVLADWDHSQRVGQCDTFLGAGDTAQVRMTITSGAPLAGLQGVLSLYPAGPPPGLMITRLVPIGPAEGMHIAWSRQLDGVHFLMFAEHGAPIGGVRNCAGDVRCEQPVLAVVVGPGPAMVVPSPEFPPPISYVSVRDLLGSDSLGTAVPECPVTTFAAVVATVCAGPSCDFNHDGTLDVRDLVTMVHCVLDTTCADTVGAALDCNGDGRLNVDDVLCCALHILHDGVRDTMPGRPEPGVAVDLGAPAWSGSGLEVPLRLRGADRVGAARLALALPLDRYDVTGVALGDGGGQWLELHDVVDGRLVLGLIGLGAGGSAPSQLDLTLRLALKPGQAAGGDVTVADLQASGPDGATLALVTTPVAVPLPSPGVLSLSPARPNPFGHETRFALNLDRAVRVEVTVHDLSGRRVATLFNGDLTAGPHDFAWRGGRDDGSTAPNGIYFLQARVGGERLTRKVIFLPGE